MNVVGEALKKTSLLPQQVLSGGRAANNGFYWPPLWERLPFDTTRNLREEI